MPPTTKTETPELIEVDPKDRGTHPLAALYRNPAFIAAWKWEMKKIRRHLRRHGTGRIVSGATGEE